MASLGNILLGSAIGHGAGNFVHGQMQGAFDRQRFDQNEAQNAQTEKVWDYQNEQMDRARQQQGIEDQSSEGATDEERLLHLADIAGKAGRGDLQRKYTGEATKAREAAQMQAISGASRAISLGQFGPATQMLNKAGIFGEIHSIGLAQDVAQDPQNPTYSVNSVQGQNEDGTPKVVPAHVTHQMLLHLQAKPGDALHWMTYAQAQGQKNDIAQDKVALGRDKLEEAVRHNKATEAWHRLNTGRSGSSRLSNEQARLQWALGQVGKPDSPFKSEMDARMWAADPLRAQKEYTAAVKTGTEILKSGGMFTAKDLGDTIAQVIANSPIGRGQQPAPAPAPAPPAPAPAPQAIDFKAAGFTQDPKSGNWKNPRTGVWFKKGPDGKPMAWSNNKGGWVSVQ